MHIDTGPAPDITVAMITMNEENAVGKVIVDIQRVVPHAEVLVVDSSRDRTPEIAAALGARVIRQFPPQGYGRAMETALRSARGRVVVTLDCDDTYPADRIPDLADSVLLEGFDLVDGSRLKHKPNAMPWLNYFANKGFAWLAGLLFLRRLTDLHSGMRAYGRDLLDVMAFDPSGPALPVELLLRPIRMKRKTKVIFIEYRERIGQTTLKPLASAWWTLKRILRVRFSRGGRPCA